MGFEAHRAASVAFSSVKARQSGRPCVEAQHAGDGLCATSLTSSSSSSFFFFRLFFCCRYFLFSLLLLLSCLMPRLWWVLCRERWGYDPIPKILNPQPSSRHESGTAVRDGSTCLLTKTWKLLFVRLESCFLSHMTKNNITVVALVVPKFCAKGTAVHPAWLSRKSATGSNARWCRVLYDHASKREERVRGCPVRPSHDATRAEAYEAGAAGLLRKYGW